MNENEKNIEQLAAQVKRDYFRKWRAANKDKVKKHNADYWRRKAIQKLEDNGGI